MSILWSWFKVFCDIHIYWLILTVIQYQAMNQASCCEPTLTLYCPHCRDIDGQVGIDEISATCFSIAYITFLYMIITRYYIHNILQCCISCMLISFLMIIITKKCKSVLYKPCTILPFEVLQLLKKCVPIIMYWYVYMQDIKIFYDFALRNS